MKTEISHPRIVFATALIFMLVIGVGMGCAMAQTENTAAPSLDEDVIIQSNTLSLSYMTKEEIMADIFDGVVSGERDGIMSEEEVTWEEGMRYAWERCPVQPTLKAAPKVVAEKADKETYYLCPFCGDGYPRYTSHICPESEYAKAVPTETPQTPDTLDLMAAQIYAGYAQQAVMAGTTYTETGMDIVVKATAEPPGHRDVFVDSIMRDALMRQAYADARRMLEIRREGE